MAGGDGPHNFPSTISLCGETNRGNFAHQHYKYITNLSAIHRKNLASLKGPIYETLVLSHTFLLGLPSLYYFYEIWQFH